MYKIYFYDKKKKNEFVKTVTLSKHQENILKAQCHSFKPLLATKNYLYGFRTPVTRCKTNESLSQNRFK